jgi:hypothetical protein
LIDGVVDDQEFALIETELQKYKNIEQELRSKIKVDIDETNE